MESVCRVILDSSRYPCPAAAEGGEQLRPSAAALYRPVADAFVSLGKMHFDWEQHSSPGLRRGLESVLGSAELDRGVAVKLLHGHREDDLVLAAPWPLPVRGPAKGCGPHGPLLTRQHPMVLP